MSVGRNRGFDLSRAVEAAMFTFWRQGFHGTSLSDLTKSMGINKSSLYGSFKSKESLFIEAVNHYAFIYGQPNRESLLNAKASNTAGKLQPYLLNIVDRITNSRYPGGCFIANSTCEVNDRSLPKEAVVAVEVLNQTSIKMLTNFFNTEIHNGNLDNTRSAESYANYVQSLQFGLAVMAKNHHSAESLQQVIELGLAVFRKEGL
ncbi:TetR/AcrR family transcriptional regulator [Marinomonas pollencensis]|uniref:TetR family transcriptional regulator n=1 Tax=Marinomonas pollencensis TaxID=491954 RepID=A0A3E0DU37_9GAMM|nr:TetR/AcrR family transcriptional regulator [Marinomonas pollencensis]REG85652.1 TetR family transcriptional regulator [Marinomonas pollencensis]